MNEEIKRKADELVDNHFIIADSSFLAKRLKSLHAKKHAIQSTKNTISVLEELPMAWETLQAINEQNEILKELESRI